jgi:hypothetical protein
MSANDEVDRSHRTRPGSLFVPSGSQRLGLVLEYLRSRDRFRTAGERGEPRESSDHVESKRDPA